MPRDGRQDPGPDSLETYRRKRRFDETPEPRGRQARRQGRLYVIQKHAARRLHYDFRLELDGVLKSWAVTRGPSLDPAQKRLAVRTEDHPVDYGAFEGTIPEGHYGAGTVMLWDRGGWEPVGDPHEGLRRGKLEFHLSGERLTGRWALVRFKGKQRGDREAWLLIKERDDTAKRRGDVLETHRTSVASGRDLMEIAAGVTPKRTRSKARKTAITGRAKAPKRAPSRRGAKGRGRMPAFVAPELATLVDAPPMGEGWIFEMKFDGYRVLLAAAGEDVRLHTRNGHDWTARFPVIAEAAAGLGLDGARIDGEVVVLDKDGRSDFAALQRALKGEGGAMSYFAFDLLAEGGEDLRKLPLAKRKTRLKRLLGRHGRAGPIFFTDHVEKDGAAMLKTLCARGFEGIIAKRAAAPYRSGRSRDWLKIKCGQQQEFVIVGWSPSTRDRPFASLLLGLREGRRLTYAGRVGTGFDRAELENLADRLARLRRKTPPVEGAIPPAIRRGASWVEPRLVAEIAFAEFTRDGLVRQGRFLGLRQDKPAGAVVREKAVPMRETTMKDDARTSSVAGVRLSHPDKVLFAEQGLTKRDLATYLERVAPVMLPQVADRLVSLVRCPDGRSKQCFFQRHAGAGLTDMFRRLEVEQKGGKREDYLYLSEVKQLVSVAQIGVLEIHVWGSRVDDIERPDRLVFDLDPGDGVAFAAVKQAAADMRDTLEALGLASVPLLTGGKGIHVVAPIARRHPWPMVKAACRAVAERLAEAAPDRFVATMAKAKRHGRIFIDYLRNERGSTAIAPFSPRARPGAPVSWPVSWNDLDGVETANAVTVGDVLSGARRPASWKRYPSRQHLKADALRALRVEAG
jgi:bifunctional non-homologous end joining protein LigD